MDLFTDLYVGIERLALEIEAGRANLGSQVRVARQQRRAYAWTTVRRAASSSADHLALRCDPRGERVARPAE